MLVCHSRLNNENVTSPQITDLARQDLQRKGSKLEKILEEELGLGLWPRRNKLGLQEIEAIKQRLKEEAPKSQGLRVELHENLCTLFVCMYIRYI